MIENSKQNYFVLDMVLNFLFQKKKKCKQHSLNAAFQNPFRISQVHRIENAIPTCFRCKKVNDENACALRPLCSLSLRTDDAAKGIVNAVSPLFSHLFEVKSYAMLK